MTLKQIVNITIKSCNDDVGGVLKAMGETLLKKGSIPWIIDAYMAGYGVEYVICNLLKGSLWDGTKYHNDLASESTISTHEEEQVVKFLECVDIFWLNIYENDKLELMNSYFGMLLKIYQSYLHIKRINLTSFDLEKLHNIIQEPVWVFILIMCLFSVDFGGIIINNNQQILN